MSTTFALDSASPLTVGEGVRVATEALVAGGVVLVPTDTIYGLMCLPTRPEAVRAIYEMKQRPTERRLPIIVTDAAQAFAELPLLWTDEAKALASSFWPGALTIACGVSAEHSVEWLTGRDEAAVRAPDHPLIQALARDLGPLFMTSANRSGSEPPTSVDRIVEDLESAPAAVIDAGTLSGASSTLVNTNLPVPEIEREGAIPAERVMAVLRDA